VGPYSTCESAGTAVFQVTLAQLPLGLTFTPLIQVVEPVEGANNMSTQKLLPLNSSATWLIECRMRTFRH
jgi:hypothetical protein